MNRLRSIVRAVLPSEARHVIRSYHREFTLRRALKKFGRSPEKFTNPSHPIFDELIYGWGNSGWSGSNEYLAECIGRSLRSSGPTLECGSGLSTLLLGIIAQARGDSHWALEHIPSWAAKVQGHIDKFGIDSVHLSTRPLKDYGEYCWYDVPLESMPKTFSLVICDGPPGETKGGRYGMVPVMRQRLGPGCIILLDDGEREQERAVAKRWEAELQASSKQLGEKKPYIELRLDSSSVS